MLAKCLGCMRGVVLLSEIHPQGPVLAHQTFVEEFARHFIARFQASVWHQLLEVPAEFNSFGQSADQFTEDMKAINAAVARTGQRLVLRDWSHLDFVGYPFQTPSYSDQLCSLMGRHFDLRHVCLIRHPIDQWLSMSKLYVFKDVHLEHFLQGYLSYLQVNHSYEFIKYEDFTADPEAVLRHLSQTLELAYDPDWCTNWSGYDRVTGDVGARNQDAALICKSTYEQLEDALLNALECSPQYQEILTLTLYQHPKQVSNRPAR